MGLNFEQEPAATSVINFLFNQIKAWCFAIWVSMNRRGDERFFISGARNLRFRVCRKRFYLLQFRFYSFWNWMDVTMSRSCGPQLLYLGQVWCWIEPLKGHFFVTCLRQQNLRAFSTRERRVAAHRLRHGRSWSGKSTYNLQLHGRHHTWRRGTAPEQLFCVEGRVV